MSAIFSGLAREDRVLPLEMSRLDTECIPRWRISVLSPSGASADVGDHNHHRTELFERVDHLWHELQCKQRIDLSAATLRRLMPTRARVRRVAMVLPPTNRSQLLDRQAQNLIPTLCRSDSSHINGSAVSPEQQRHPQLSCLPLCCDSPERRALMLHPFAASDVLLNLLCPNATQHPLPYTADTDRGRVLAERYASTFCVTSQQFHVLACLVWIQLEAVAQRLPFQTFAELAVHVTGATDHILPMPVEAAKWFRLQGPLRKAVTIITEEWLAFRAMHISAATPCGVPAVLLTTDRSFVLAASPMAEVLVPLVPSSVAKEAHPFGLPPRPLEIGDDGALTNLWRRVAALFAEYGLLLLVSPLQILKQLVAEAAAAAPPLRPLPRRSQGHGDSSRSRSHCYPPAKATCQHQWDDGMLVPPLLLRTSDTLSCDTSELQCFTAADVADAVCHIGGPLLLPPPTAASSGGLSIGQSLRPMTRVELSRTQRELIERLLSLRCRSMLVKAYQRGAALQWVVQRCAPPQPRPSDTSVPPSSGTFLAPQLILAVVHTNGAVTHLGSPRDIVSASSDAALMPNAAAPGVTLRPTSSCPEQLLENIPLSKITRGVIDHFIAAVVDHGALLRSQQAPPVALQSTQPPTLSSQTAPQPLLRMMHHQLLIPVAVTATALHYVLQCHPESKYIAGCGVRCLYVNSSGKLVVERVCYRFCEWDHRLSFKNGGCSGASSVGQERRDRTLREPMLVMQSAVHHPLPPNVAWSRATLPSLLDMLRYYREELDAALAHRPETVPDKRMMLFDEDAAVVKYVLSHHGLYFARRGCGVDGIFVTASDSGPTATAQHDSAARVALRGGCTDAGECHVLRHCGTTVAFRIEECFDAKGNLRLPDVLTEPHTEAARLNMKRGRSEVDSLPWW